jgi:hypothetical protein
MLNNHHVFIVVSMKVFPLFFFSMSTSDLFGGKSPQNATQFSEKQIFCCKFLFLMKKISQIVIENNFVFGEGVTTFMST